MDAVPPATSHSSSAGESVAPSLVRTYRAWKGNNVFCLQGRLIFGPDVKTVFISLFLILAPVAVFCAFVARKLIHGFSHHSGWSIMIIVIVLTLFVLISLVLTSGRDPGIVPRNAYPPEPDDDDVTANMFDEQSPRPRLPRTKIVIVNGVSVKIKYCDTCQLYRSLRCSHCSVCDNCVERFDHHCPWLGQCIGLRNYRFFCMFLFSTTLLCLYIHGFCWVYIKKIMGSEEISIWKAMTKTPASIALIIYTSIWVWFVGGLSIFHTYLISTNQSTYENFRYRYDRQLVNPYDRGIAENFKEVFCTSIPPSKNNFRAKVPKETSYPGQRVGARSSLSPMLRKSTRNEVESDYRNGFTNVERSKESVLANMSQDFSMTLHKEGAERQETSILRDSLWERTSRKWDIAPEVLDRTGESNWTANGSSSVPSGNSTKVAP